jgi:hypothetical protein
MFAPGVPEVMRNFNSTNDMLKGFMVSVYVLGFSFGPLSMFFQILHRKSVLTSQSSPPCRRCTVASLCIILATFSSLSSPSRLQSRPI